jgi:plastocyanin
VKNPFLAALVAGALCAGIFGCGGDDDKGGTATTGGTTTGAEETTTDEETTGGEKAESGEARKLTSTTVKVDAVDISFQPANPRVKPGTVTFRIRNKGTLLHAAEVEGPSGDKGTKPILPGKTATLRVELDKPGRYTWYCPIENHRKLGMKGKIRVR